MKIHLSIFFTLFCGILTAQNLVPNPSFEQTNTTFCGIMTTSDFENTMSDWRTPSNGTPDLYFTNNATDCYNHQPENQYNGPIGIKGEEMPRTGEVMAGIGVYTIEGFNQREYLQIELASSLEIGNTYEVTYYISLADYIEFSADKLGVYFTEIPISASNDEVMDYLPQISPTIALDNSTGWTEIKATFEALGAYSYLTIGNFSPDSGTTLSPNPTASGGVGTYGAYYFIDDISVVDVTPSAVYEFAEAGLTLSPNPTTGLVKIHQSKPLEAATLRLYNSLGVMVLEQKLSQNNLSEFDFSAFANGYYVLSIETATSIFVEQLVKF